jgi:hypothetical protein
VLGINFRNYGRTPALVKSLTIDFALADKPPKPSDAVSIRTFSEDMVIPQDEGWPRNYYISGWKGGPDLKKLVAGHKPTGPRLFVYGIMIYEDAFGISRRTEFCRVFDGKGFTYNQGDVDPLNKAT